MVTRNKTCLVKPAKFVHRNFVFCSYFIFNFIFFLFNVNIIIFIIIFFKVIKFVIIVITEDN